MWVKTQESEGIQGRGSWGIKANDSEPVTPDRCWHPLTCLQEPPECSYANCEIVSETEMRSIMGDRPCWRATVGSKAWETYVARVYTSLPILPLDQLFLHKGASYGGRQSQSLRSSRSDSVDETQVGYPAPAFFDTLERSAQYQHLAGAPLKLEPKSNTKLFTNSSSPRNHDLMKSMPAGSGLAATSGIRRGSNNYCNSTNKLHKIRKWKRNLGLWRDKRQLVARFHREEVARIQKVLTQQANSNMNINSSSHNNADQEILIDEENDDKLELDV